MKNVLYIEDDIDDQSLFEEACNKLKKPVQYQIASDGYTALEKLQTPPPVDLVLLDLNMPLLNGIDTLRAIKQTDNLRDIPIYILTTSGSITDKEKCEKLGAKGFITKPHNFEQYCQNINAVFERELFV